MQQHAVTPAGRILLDGEAIGRTLSRIAHELIERNDDLEAVALVGIHTRGVPLSQRLRRLIAERAGLELELGQLDITFHRDDVHVREGQAPRRRQPVVRDTKLDFELEGRTVILVDDVLYTGRTIRAAIDALLEYGRPARVQLSLPKSQDRDLDLARVSSAYCRIKRFPKSTLRWLSTWRLATTRMLNQTSRH